MIYGTIEEADAFFAARLHNWDWTNGTEDDKLRALAQATELVDQFDFIDDKADPEQELEFPRTGQSEVPVTIRRATYLIAQSLLSGRDPNADLENLALKTEVYAGLRAEYHRKGNPQEHMANLVPNPQAWNLIRPWLRVVKTFSW